MTHLTQFTTAVAVFIASTCSAFAGPAEDFTSFMENFSGHWKGKGTYFHRDQGYSRFNVDTYTDPIETSVWETKAYLEFVQGSKQHDLQFSLVDGEPAIFDIQEFKIGQLLKVSPNSLSFQVDSGDFHDFTRTTYNFSVVEANSKRKLVFSEETLNSSFQLIHSTQYEGEYREF